MEFYFGYAWPIYDCADCGCRFTLHDNATYDFLYSEQSSCYSRYEGQAQACKALFDSGDLAGLRTELSQSAKYKFVIDELSHAPSDARLLELGSSKGHLTSYFVLAGYRITGVDISPRAVSAARSVFGDHFVEFGDSTIERQAPYDSIFHVGTIGCVADPVAMTEYCLRLLKPGGRLLFNAPNVGGCLLPDQLWFESAPPPDLVTLFRSGFWREHFGELATVSESIERRPLDESALIALRRLVRRKWRAPVPLALMESKRWSMPRQTLWDTVWSQFERVVRKIVRLAGSIHFIQPYPTEYGLFVKMIKK